MPNKKTFLLFVPWMVPGGADRCGLDMLRYYKLKGWRTVVCSTRENPQGNLWRHEFSKYADHLIDLGHEWRRGKHIEAIHAAVKSCHPRVVCINNSHEAHECVRMIRRLAPDCLLTTLLHMDIPGAWDFPGRSAKNADVFDKIICVSETLVESVRKRITIIGARPKVQALTWFPWWPPPRMAMKADVRKELLIPQDQKVVVCPMRIAKQKNPLMVCEVAKQMPEVLFLVAGDGDMRAEMAAAAPRNMRILGYIDNQDIPRLLCAADSLFLPSRDEGIPLVYMEAFATCVPVVASDVGGVHELVIHGTTGHLLDKDSTAKEWAGAIASSFSQGMVGAALRMVESGPFSLRNWQERMGKIMDDTPVQAAPLVRMRQPVPLTKVFIIGAPKTGTSSVGAALEMLGCRVKGFDPVIQDYHHHGHDKPAFEQVSMYDAFSDGPYNTGDFYRKLDKKFPGSRYVLTLRDEESWAKSHRAHFAPDGTNAKVKERYRHLEYDPEQWLEWYQKRNSEIRGFFGGRRLLIEMDVFEWEDDKCWQALCEGIPGLRPPPPGTPFPHVNKTTYLE